MHRGAVCQEARPARALGAPGAEQVEEEVGGDGGSREGRVATPTSVVTADDALGVLGESATVGSQRAEGAPACPRGHLAWLETASGRWGAAAGTSWLAARVLLRVLGVQDGSPVPNKELPGPGCQGQGGGPGPVLLQT